MKANIKSNILLLFFAICSHLNVFSQWQIFGESQMKNTNTGNVGIGTGSTVNLPKKLEVVGNRIRVQASTSSSSKMLDLRTDGNGVDVNAVNGDLKLHSTSSNTYIQSGGGNVGINASFSNAALQFNNAPFRRKVVLFEYANNDYQFTGFGRYTKDGVNLLDFHTATNYTNHIFYAGESTSSSKELLRIEGNGNVGILKNPGKKLDVNGNIRCNNIVQTSDMRFKKDVRNVDAALGKIMKLRGTSYAMRTGEFEGNNFPAGLQLGFIAQEVKAVTPELAEADQEGYFSVNYTGMAPILVEAYKEQQSRLEQKERQMRDLTEELSELEAKLATLEQAFDD